MKKIIIALALIVATAVPTLSSAQTLSYTPANLCVNLTRDLTIGSTGEDVRQLQYFLQKEYLNEPPTGYFGQATQSAVARFQVSVGVMPASGYVGPLTRAYIRNATCGGTTTPPIIPGCIPGAAYSATTGQSCNTGTSTPAVVITYPKGGENFKTGDRMEIRWSPAKAVTVIEILKTDGTFSEGIYGPKYGNNKPITSGSFDYKLKYKYPAGAYIVRITFTDNGILKSNVFNINQIGANTPSIQVMEPNGGEKYTAGTFEDGILKYNSLNPGPIDVYLTSRTQGTLDDTKYSLSLNALSGTLEFAIKLPTTLSPGEYKITACSESTPLPKAEFKPLCDSSDKYFTVSSPSTTDGIVITNPSSGSQVKVGSTLQITWTGSYSGVYDLSFHLMKGGVEVRSISNSNVSNGKLYWVVPNDLRYDGGLGNDYTIEARGKAYSTESGRFSIVDSNTPTGPSSITVISPNDAVLWQQGLNATIQWKSENPKAGDYVTLQLIKRNNTQVVSIGGNHPASGTYTYKIPTNLEGEFKVMATRYSAGAAGGVYDESNNYITIAPSTPVPPTNVTGTFNQSTLTSSSPRPTISGTVSSRVLVRIKINDLSGNQVWKSNYVTASDENNDYVYEWSFPVTQNLSPGKYIVSLNTQTDEIDRENLTITSSDTRACTKNWDARGDLNSDGKVEFSDMLIHAQNSGKTGMTFAQGDANKDGKVDYLDLVIISNAYNSCKPL